MHRAVLLCFLVGVASSIVTMGRIGHVKEPAAKADKSTTVNKSEPRQNEPKARITGNLLTPGATTAPPISAAQADQAQSIVELREQLGGSLLQDTLLGDSQPAADKEQDFLNALHGQLSEGIKKSTEQCDDRYQQLLNEPEELPVQATGQPVDLARLPSYSEAQAQVDLSAVLRTAGRHLDRHASDFEDLGDYQRSDELRRLARRIRAVAREYRSDQSASGDSR